ncbi:MAG: DsbA family protein, partial [Candidatus Poseidoniia archaeon]
WQLVRLDTNWQWYRRDGQWNYEPVTLTQKVADGTLATTIDGAPAKIEAPVRYGRYRLEVTSADPAGPASSVAFTAGWYTASGDVDSPDILDVALDRASFDTCITSDAAAKAVADDLAAGQAAGTTGTPAFYVNGIKLSGARPLDDFVEVIEAELARAAGGV